MARQRRIIFGDTSDLIFNVLPLRKRERTPTSTDYLPGGEDIPTLKLKELKGKPILDWPPRLPDFDPRGHKSADNGYKPGKNAKAGKKGMSGYFYSHKARMPIPLHSDLERRLATALELNPYVVEIRAQYSEWEAEDLAKVERGGRRMARMKIMNLDFMVTLKIPGQSGFLYHVVSGKPHALVKDHQSRFSNERDAANAWGATHEVQTELTIPDLEYENNLTLLEYMKDVDDLAALSVPAQKIADELKKANISGALSRVLKIVANRLELDVNTCYRHFAVAHFFGHLVWDHGHQLARDKPLKLKKD